MKKGLKRFGIFLLVVLGCVLVYLVYAFRFSPHPDMIYAADGKVKFGYDPIQGKWLFNEYRQHELSTDGPHIFRETGEILYVRGNKKKYSLESTKFTDLPDSLTCYVDELDTFRFKLRDSYTTDTCIYPMPEKMFILSDIEGNFKAFKDLLVGNKVVDSNLNWIYGNGHMVLVGDFVDRGTEVTQCLWLIYKLEQEAQAHGGKLHYILGNHEVMNLYGDTRYVRGKYLELVRRRKMLYAQLFAPNTELGRWLRTKNTIEKIGDIIFVHAGISPQVAGAGFTLPQINDISRQYLDIHYSDITDENAALLMGKKGILWYRGLVTVYEVQKLTGDQVADITTKMNCKHIAIGHTVVPDISFDFDKMVIRLNVRHAKREPGAMIVEGGKFFRTDTKGNMREL